MKLITTIVKLIEKPQSAIPENQFISVSTTKTTEADVLGKKIKNNFGQQIFACSDLDET